MTARDRYLTDPVFRRVADFAVAVLADSCMDVASLTEAFVHGAQLYAERYGAPIVVRVEDARDSRR